MVDSAVASRETDQPAGDTLKEEDDEGYEWEPCEHADLEELWREGQHQSNAPILMISDSKVVVRGKRARAAELLDFAH